MKKNEAYAIAGEEISASKLNAGIWALAFSQAEGDETKAKAIYIKLRAKEVMSQHGVMQTLFLPYSTFWLGALILTFAASLWIKYATVKKEFLNSDPVLTMQIPWRGLGDNRVVQWHRQQFTNDSRSNDEITIEVSFKYPDAFQKYDDAVADLNRIRRDLLMKSFPQFEDVLSLSGLSGAFGGSLGILIMAFLASFCLTAKPRQPGQFISVWIAAWVLIVAAQIVVLSYTP